MIDSKQLNELQKEQLCNAILYFGDQLEEKVVIDVLNDRKPMKYDTATKERLLTGLLEEGHTHLSEIEKQFCENPSMKVMFFNECVQTKDFSKAGKQTLKAVFDKNYTRIPPHICVFLSSLLWYALPLCESQENFFKVAMREKTFRPQKRPERRWAQSSVRMPRSISRIL